MTLIVFYLLRTVEAPPEKLIIHLVVHGYEELELSSGLVDPRALSFLGIIFQSTLVNSKQMKPQTRCLVFPTEKPR